MEATHIRRIPAGDIIWEPQLQPPRWIGICTHCRYDVALGDPNDGGLTQRLDVARQLVDHSRTCQENLDNA